MGVHWSVKYQVHIFLPNPVHLLILLACIARQRQLLPTPPMWIPHPRRFLLAPRASAGAKVHLPPVRHRALLMLWLHVDFYLRLAQVQALRCLHLLFTIVHYLYRFLVCVHFCSPISYLFV